LRELLKGASPQRQIERAAARNAATLDHRSGLVAFSLTERLGVACGSPICGEMPFDSSRDRVAELPKTFASSCLRGDPRAERDDGDAPHATDVTAKRDVLRAPKI
jgi:hypothetical protein